MDNCLTHGYCWKISPQLMFSKNNTLKVTRKIENTMFIICNTGVSCTNLVGDLEGDRFVLYNRNGIANIIFLSKLADKNMPTFDI